MISVTEKPCSKCKKIKPITDFSKRVNRKDQYRPDCKDCANEYRRQYMKDHPEIAREQYRRKAERILQNPEQYAKQEKRYLRRKIRDYDLTIAEYQTLWEKQGGLCAICGNPETAKQNGKTRSLAIDHDHATGKVRGLLCLRCNVGLKVVESEELLVAALAYLAS